MNFNSVAAQSGINKNRDLQAVKLEIASFPEGFDQKATKLLHYATKILQ